VLVHHTLYNIHSFVIATAELSEVLWTMALRRAVSMAFIYGTFMGAVAVFGIFAFWASE